MFGKIFGASGPGIVRNGDKITLMLRTRLLAAMLFATIMFLGFFVFERDQMLLQIGEGGWWAGVTIAAVSIWISLSRLLDKRPFMEISPAGLAFPRQFADVLPWESIAEMTFARGTTTVVFDREMRLQWYPKFLAVPGREGRAGAGFLSRYEVPWIKVRVNYLWPVSLEALRNLIAENRPK